MKLFLNKLFLTLLLALSVPGTASLDLCPGVRRIGAGEASQRDFQSEKLGALASLQDVQGAFSEIGAGQEVSKLLLQSDAKFLVRSSVSPYSMVASDRRYGPAGGTQGVDYVTKQRLISQLEREFRSFANDSNFRKFAFASSSQTQRGDGLAWVGIKAEVEKGKPPVQILMQVRLRSAKTSSQKEQLGKFGLNLLHAVYFHSENPEVILESLKDSIENENDVVVEECHVEGLVNNSIGFRAGKILPRLARERISRAQNLGANRQTTPTEKTRFINDFDELKGIISDVGGGQTLANRFFDAGNSHTIFEAVHFAPNSSEALKRYPRDAGNKAKKQLETEYPSIQAKRPHRKFVLANNGQDNGTELSGSLGYLGQLRQNGPRNQFILGYKIRGGTSKERAEALGDLGVNLLYGIYHRNESSELLLPGLTKNSRGLEISIVPIEISGPDLPSLRQEVVNNLAVEFQTEIYKHDPDTITNPLLKISEVFPVEKSTNESLQKIVTDLVKEHTAAPFEVEIPRSSSLSGSPVYLARSTEGEGGIAVKFYTGESQHRDLAQELAGINAFQGVNKGAVPTRVIGLKRLQINNASYTALLTDIVPGENLEDMIVRVAKESKTNPKASEQLLKPFEQAGRVLGEIHFRVKPGTLRTPYAQSTLDYDINAVKKLVGNQGILANVRNLFGDAVITSKELAALSEKISRMVAQHQKNLPMEFVATHRDFKPANMTFNPNTNRIGLYDLSKSNWGLDEVNGTLQGAGDAALDVGRFLEGVLIYGVPAGLPERELPRLKESFLKGYNAYRREIGQPPLEGEAFENAVNFYETKFDKTVLDVDPNLQISNSLENTKALIDQMLKRFGVPRERQSRFFYFWLPLQAA